MMAANDRRKRRRELRRQKRHAMQTMLNLKGWVPVKCEGENHYGIYHPTTRRLVLRTWIGRSLSPGQTGWTIQTGIAPQLTEDPPVECDWNDLQLRWVYALRSTAIQRGFLE